MVIDVLAFVGPIQTSVLSQSAKLVTDEAIAAAVRHTQELPSLVNGTYQAQMFEATINPHRLKHLSL